MGLLAPSISGFCNMSLDTMKNPAFIPYAERGRLNLLWSQLPWIWKITKFQLSGPIQYTIQFLPGVTNSKTYFVVIRVGLIRTQSANLNSSALSIFARSTFQPLDALRNPTRDIPSSLRHNTLPIVSRDCLEEHN